MFFILNVLPKGLLLLIFSWDILVNKQFSYIYQFAWLILIPLVFHYTIFTIKEFSEWNINLLNTEFIIVKSIKYGYILDTTALIRECCCTYYEDIYDLQPEHIINRIEAIPIHIGHEYIFREEPARIYDTEDATRAYFNRVLEGFDFMRKLREIVYKLEHCPLYWKYLYFNVFLYSTYLFLWLSIFFNLPNNFYINGELLFLIQNIEEPFSLIELPPQ